jgi:hypothetical protein
MFWEGFHVISSLYRRYFTVEGYNLSWHTLYQSIIVSNVAPSLVSQSATGLRQVVDRETDGPIEAVIVTCWGLRTSVSIRLRCRWSSPSTRECTKPWSRLLRPLRDEVCYSSQQQCPWTAVAPILLSSLGKSPSLAKHFNIRVTYLTTAVIRPLSFEVVFNHFSFLTTIM